MWITGSYPQAGGSTLGSRPLFAHTDAMNHLLLTTTARDLITSLLTRPLDDPTPPSLPPGSRTAAALRRAADSWSLAHRLAGDQLRDQLRDTARFAAHVDALDASLARSLGGAP